VISWQSKRPAIRVILLADRVSHAALAALKNYYWPGNVRELENIIERAMVVSPGSELKLVDDLQSPMEQPVVSYTEQTLAEVERKHITQTLEKVDWRIEGDAGAAKILGMHPSTLRYTAEEKRQ